MEFWAKTTSTGEPGVSVFNHMVNVGCVASFIAGTVPVLLKRFGLTVDEVGTLAALHDLGKISPGFQQKCEKWLVVNDLVDKATNGNWKGGTETDHGKVSHAAIQDFLISMQVARDAAMYLAAALGAHHGKLKFIPNPRGIKPPLLISNISEEFSGIDWKAARHDSAQKVWEYFGIKAAPAGITGDKAAIWWLAGLTTVADWIGSDERFFSPATATADPAANAIKAADSIGLIRPVVMPNLTFSQLFGFVPNDMQSKALTVITGPGVYVIEAPMGMGKTEAALGSAYQLLASGKASGIYFALPTQATSNRIHLRMNDFLKRIAPAAGGSRLIHGNSWLMNDMQDGYRPAKNAFEKTEDDARSGRGWFASSKRALLAPFGVGTIDQVLLGVVAAKHFFVRRFALAGKVVIIDEVHSYDVYTGALIDELVQTLEQLGCTVIILSATLTAKRLTQLLSMPECHDTQETRAYPLLSGRAEQLPFAPITSTPPPSKKIIVEFLKADSATDEAIATANAGGCVLWICNTISAAQQQYRRLQSLAGSNTRLGLLHSRMIFSHREKREEEWMQRLGKESSDRCGSILVSTQVVEQSVDLDADLMISELAPTDMLLQRLGRLWRHEREGRPVAAPRVCIIEEEKALAELQEMPPKAIIKVLGSKANVYAPYVLLRTLEVWRAQTEGVTIPSQIRSLIEHTYCDRQEEPDSWQQLYDEWFGTDSAKKLKAQMSANIWQQAMDDQEGVQTRLNELQTISLVLCSDYSKINIMFADGTLIRTDEEFSFEAARVLHRNLVKTPRHHFHDQIESGKLGEYLFEEHLIGVVGADGVVSVNGLKDGVTLRYTEELGLTVTKP